MVLLNRKAAQSIEKIGGADFLVRIVFRQNASWQGEVHWLNTDKKKRFRSFLELTMLLNQCMGESGYPGCDYSLQSWEDPNQSGGDIEASRP